MHPTVQIVIPVFDRHQHIAPLLLSLSQQTLKPIRVVVVDHGTTNLVLSDSYGLSVEIIKRPSTMWFTAATNEGLKHSLNTQSDFLMILNDDVTLTSNHWLEALVNLAINEDAIAASSAISAAGKTYYRAIQFRELRFRYESVGEGTAHDTRSEKISDCDVLPTRGIVFRPDVLAKIGFLDESLPHHGSDYEWTARAKSAGIRLVMSNAVWLVTDSEPILRSHKSLVAETKDYFQNNHLKGSFPVASRYSKLVFQPTYRIAFLAVHASKFTIKAILKRIKPSRPARPCY